jgi:hypothetical protein
VEGKASKALSGVSFGFPLDKLWKENMEMDCIYQTGRKKLCITNGIAPDSPDVGVFIDKNYTVWGLGDALAQGVMDTYGDRMCSQIIPGTDYVIIFDEDSVVEVYSHKYIFNDCLIMKATDKGAKCIPADEVDDVRRAFRKNTVNYLVGPVEFKAYRLT